MRSVAGVFRADTVRRVAQMSVAERLRLAFELGEADLRLLMSTRAVSRDEARRVFARSRQHGRTPSRAARQ
jgi:hypothetical protein